MRNIFFILFLLPFIGKSQIIIDFEDQDSLSWTQSPVSRWTISDENPISGFYSLRQTYNNSSSDVDQISLDISGELNPVSQDIAWRFLVKYAYNPSSGNHWGVYLMGDISVPEMYPGGNAQGYVLGINLNGFDDTLRLYRVNSSEQIAIISTLCNWQQDIGTSAIAAIEVIRNTTGLWEIKISDDADFNNLNVIGSGSDTTYTTADHFGIFYKYTSSADQKLWIDDIYMGALITDTISPKILESRYISDHEIRLTFSEEIDTTTLFDKSNYLLDILKMPDSIKQIGPNQILLDFVEGFTNEQNHQLQVSNICDYSSNCITDTTLYFFYYKPEVHDIVINEILADPTPSVGLPEYEFIELFNATPYPISLESWQISVNGKTATFPTYQIDSGEYLIIGSTSAISEFDIYGPALAIPSFPAINNAGAEILITDSSGLIISSVTFDQTWYQDSEKVNGGWSLEKRNPTNNCSGFQNWRASESSNGGTPGIENSVYSSFVDNIPPEIVILKPISNHELYIEFSEQIDTTIPFTIDNFIISGGIGSPEMYFPSSDCSNTIVTYTSEFVSGTHYNILIDSLTDNCGNSKDLFEYPFDYYIPIVNDVVINEIMADPTPPVNLPEEEYLEIFNTTSFSIDLTSWQIMIDSNVAYFPEYNIKPNEYLVMCNSGALASIEEFSSAVSLPSFPSIPNSGSEIMLKDTSGQVISRVNYNQEWYHNSDKEDGGWSIERRNPWNNCSESENWTASNSELGGTPGGENSAYSNFTDTIIPFIESVSVVSNNQLEILFSEPIPATLLEKETNYYLSHQMKTPFSVIGEQNQKKAVLYFSESFEDGHHYKLKIDSLLDNCGNFTVNLEILFDYHIPQLFDIVINEVMADPEPALNLPEIEYIELYNRSEFNISLHGWKLDCNGKKSLFSEGVIKPFEYIILIDQDNVNLFKNYEHVIGLSSFPTLPNSEATILLEDDKGNLISITDYTTEWFGDDFRLNGGWSFEQIDINNPCGDQGNWKISEHPDGGTPGFQNSIFSENPDTDLPYIERVGVKNDSCIILYLSEKVKVTDPYMADYFTIDHNVGQPAFISSPFPISQTIFLHFTNSLSYNTTYTIAVDQNIFDCIGNRLDENQIFTFRLPEAVQESDIVINEILFNPHTGGSDFIELVNNSDKIIDLNSLFIANKKDGRINDFNSFSNESYLFYPQNYLVITVDGETLSQYYFVEDESAVIEIDNMPSFPDAEGIVAILNNQYNTIDEVHYTEDMHFELIVNDEGVSLERMSFDYPSSDHDNWHSASETVGYATPTYLNSQTISEFTDISPITIENEVFSPDNDGFEDSYIIHYSLNGTEFIANIKIYDSAGRLVRYLKNNALLGAEGAIIWDGLTDDKNLAKQGIYAVYIEIFDKEGDVRKYSEPCVLAR